MKPRQRILGFLVASISVYVSIELFLQYNWRADYPASEVESLKRILSLEESSQFKLPLIVIHSTNHLEPDIPGFEISKSAPEEISDLTQNLFEYCCSSMSDKCINSLKKASEVVKDSFLFFHDTSCRQQTPPVNVDNVGYSVSFDPEFLQKWRQSRENPPKFTGPFKSMYPIVFVRSIHVLTGDTARKNHSDLTPLLSSFDGIFDIIHESTTLYGGPQSLRAIEQSLVAPDLHEQSRLINKEFMVWTGSSHISPFGTYFLPPIAYIATVDSSAISSTGLYEVENFGFIHIPNESDDPIPEITRLWFGKDLPTQSETISLRMHARNIFLTNAIKNLSRLKDILAEFSDIRFPGSTAAVVESAIHHIEESLRTKSLPGSLHHARIAVIESQEALNDEFVSDPPFFSIEYTFALYAPLTLPISVPITSALIRYIRERRNKLV